MDRKGWKRLAHVDVVHRVRPNLGVAERGLHGTRRAAPARGRLRDVVRIAAHAVAQHLAVEAAHAALRSERLLIESRWVRQPLAFAGQLRPRRLNK